MNTVANAAVAAFETFAELGGQEFASDWLYEMLAECAFRDPSDFLNTLHVQADFQDTNSPVEIALLAARLCYRAVLKGEEFDRAAWADSAERVALKAREARRAA